MKKSLFNLYVYFLTLHKLRGELQSHIFPIHFILSEYQFQIIKLAFIEHSLGVMLCAKCFLCIVSFSSHTELVWWVPPLSGETEA